MIPHFLCVCVVFVWFLVFIVFDSGFVVVVVVVGLGLLNNMQSLFENHGYNSFVYSVSNSGRSSGRAFRRI